MQCPARDTWFSVQHGIRQAFLPSEPERSVLHSHAKDTRFLRRGVDTRRDGYCERALVFSLLRADSALRTVSLSLAAPRGRLRATVAHLLRGRSDSSLSIMSYVGFRKVRPLFRSVEASHSPSLRFPHGPLFLFAACRAEPCRAVPGRTPRPRRPSAAGSAPSTTARSATRASQRPASWSATCWCIRASGHSPAPYALLDLACKVNSTDTTAPTQARSRLSVQFAPRSFHKNTP